jgi:hypothetical protein
LPNRRAQRLRLPQSGAGKSDDGDDEEQGREENAEENEQEEVHLVPRPKNTRTRNRALRPAGTGRHAVFRQTVLPCAPRRHRLGGVRGDPDAMSRQNVAGLARVVLSTRERPMLITPMGNGLCGETLRFAHEVRGQEEYFSGIPAMKLPAEMVKLAQHIIETKSADFDPAMLEDHCRNALVRILKKKRRRCLRPRSRSRPRAKTSST